MQPKPRWVPPIVIKNMVKKLGIKETAKELGVSVRTIYRWCKGGFWLFRR